MAGSLPAGLARHELLGRTSCAVRRGLSPVDIFVAMALGLNPVPQLGSAGMQPNCIFAIAIAECARASTWAGSDYIWCPYAQPTLMFITSGLLVGSL